MVRYRGPGLERVAEHVQAGRGVHGSGHGARVERVADAERGLEVPMCEACLCVGVGEVEDGGAGGLGTGAGGGGDGDEREEGFSDGLAAAEGGVDEVEEGGVCEVVSDDV